MGKKTKIAFYILLTLSACFFTWRFRSNYTRLMAGGEPVADSDLINVKLPDYQKNAAPPRTTHRLADRRDLREGPREFPRGRARVRGGPQTKTTPGTLGLGGGSPLQPLHQQIESRGQGHRPAPAHRRRVRRNSRRRKGPQTAGPAR